MPPVLEPLSIRKSSSRRACASLLLVTVALGCGRLTPPGFWVSYRSELIHHKFSDQGPWGGSRSIFWMSPAPGTFRASDAIRFAASSGWSCGNPVRYSAAEISAWRYAGRPVFPLLFGSADHAPNDASVLDFARYISEHSLVVECKTGWIRVEPGTGHERNAFGYIQIDERGTRMAVYHLWGEA